MALKEPHGRSNSGLMGAELAEAPQSEPAPGAPSSLAA